MKTRGQLISDAERIRDLLADIDGRMAEVVRLASDFEGDSDMAQRLDMYRELQARVAAQRISLDYYIKGQNKNS